MRGQLPYFAATYGSCPRISRVFPVFPVTCACSAVRSRPRAASSAARARRSPCSRRSSARCTTQALAVAARTRRPGTCARRTRRPRRRRPARRRGGRDVVARRVARAEHRVDLAERVASRRASDRRSPRRPARLGRILLRRGSGRPNRRPPLRLIRPARTPPATKPDLNARRMLRVRRRSSKTQLARSATSYGASAGRRRVAGTQRREDRARGEDPGLHRVVDALQRSDVDEPRGVADHDQAVAVEPLRHRPVAALGDRLRAPLEQLAAVEDRAHERVGLEPLQQPVHVEGRAPR